MALLVNFAAIEMSTYLNKWYYVKLGILVLAASIIVTLVNKYLIRHEKSDIVIIDEIDDELLFNEVETKVVDSIDVLPTNPNETETVIIVPKEDKSKTTADNKVETETEVKVTVPPKFLQKAPEIEERKKPIETKPADTKVPEKVVEVPQTDTKSVATITTDIKKAEVNQPPKSSAENETKNTKPVDKKEAKQIEDAKIKLIPNEKVEDTKDKSQGKSFEKSEDKLFDINAHLGSLDDILDYAYAQKTNGDLKQAILA